MAQASEAEGRRWPGGEVGRAVAQFAASGLLALVLLGAAGVYLLRETGRDEAIRNAKQVTALAAHSLVEPNADARRSCAAIPPRSRASTASSAARSSTAAPCA